MAVVVLYIVFCAVVGYLFYSKGYSVVLGVILSLLISPLITGIIMLFMNPKRNIAEQRRMTRDSLVKCPFCAELIKIEAKFCAHCGNNVTKVAV